MVHDKCAFNENCDQPPLVSGYQKKISSKDTPWLNPETSASDVQALTHLAIVRWYQMYGFYCFLAIICK